MKVAKKIDLDKLVTDPYVRELIRQEKERQRAFPPASNLRSTEVFWRDHQVWLQEQGYMLRSRYHADWVPSILSRDKDDIRKPLDAYSPRRPHILDARKIATGQFVMLKKILKTKHRHEVDIHEYLTTGDLASHPHNHCAPLYDVLESPYDENVVILVLPLYRMFDDPPFQTVGEVVDFCRQIFEGLRFIHQNHVAHRDCGYMNIMMDATDLYPDGFHPVCDIKDAAWSDTLAKHYTRTQTPVKYYFIDFGISCRFDPDDPEPRAFPRGAGDKTAPELSGMPMCPIDPFPTDVYYIGNVIRTNILTVYQGLDFVTPLVNDMVSVDPKKRPTMDEVVERFERIRYALPWWKLRARLWSSMEDGHPWMTFTLNCHIPTNLEIVDATIPRTLNLSFTDL
ncbi:hypothetical protein NLI96_g9841 [Meripilus lineatus]|uniref:Protein kinase domain-containing protein n=1 Tax=Meripilus lineatus TaxID=2056292 RepID=A0AAD5Y9T6_9APHY|nr:hypothetical protein NLI96_g9841 [Physisporinus lineatus]